MNATSGENPSTGGNDYLSTQMMFVFGSLVTALSGIVIGLGRSLMSYVWSIIFFEMAVDEDRQDSAEPGLVERVYDHVIVNRSNLQGWRGRVSRQIPISKEKQKGIKNHRFVIPEGGCLFWAGWASLLRRLQIRGELVLGQC